MDESKGFHPYWLRVLSSFDETICATSTLLPQANLLLDQAPSGDPDTLTSEGSGIPPGAF